LERFARDKHSIFLREFVNYGQRSFITLAPELPVDVHGEQGGGGIEDGSLKKNSNFWRQICFQLLDIIDANLGFPFPVGKKKDVSSRENIFLLLFQFDSFC
jgi:hypothetical protein